jgi:hypothetical protein
LRGPGILAWVRTSSPTPPREDAPRHVTWLRERGMIGTDDLRQLRAAGYA